MMGQRHLARHGHLAAADQPHVGHGLVGRDMGVWSHSRVAYNVFPPTAQQEWVWDTPTVGFALQPKLPAVSLEPFSRRLSPLKFQRPSICGGRKDANSVLQAQGWEVYLPDLGLADPQPPGLPQVPHRLDLEAQQLRPDHVSR
jgi:hypothetical protein